MNLQGKKFVVIGGTGLIGSHTVDLLAQENVFASMSEKNAIYELLYQLQTKKSGYFVFIEKSPLREFCDDYIKDYLQRLTPKNAWKQLASLTKLGTELGKFNIQLNIPESISMLGIPAGKIDLQH